MAEYKQESLTQIPVSAIARVDGGDGADPGEGPSREHHRTARERTVDSSELPGDSSELPGSSSELPGDSMELPGASRSMPTAASSDESDSFSEADSDEWLSSESGSSRASSPEDPDTSRDPPPIGKAKRIGRAPSSGSCAKRARGSSRGCGQDDGWYDDDDDEWEPNRFPFTEESGPQGTAAELNSCEPADFLELFLTEELLQHIVDQTNLYARQHFETHKDTNVWKPLSVPELKKFLGLSFITGFLKKPSIPMYWCVEEHDATPYFAKIMSRNRYQNIWRFLHYNDNRSQDASDKMYKVRPVLDYLVNKFKALYNPGENICIDEGMMQWRGQLSFRVYNPQKPVKYGIKSYILYDSATGYCFNMQPYVGTSSTIEDTVVSLLDRLNGKGHTLFMDNFNNSVSLCEHLLAKKTNVCGTLRKNRGEPNIIKELPKTGKVGERIVRHNGKVMVVAWQDKRLVKMVTTCHENTMERVEVWQKGVKQKVPQWKPACVVAYNTCMDGLDKLDQNVAYYPFIRRSLNWSKKFVAYLIQLSVFNAFVLYRARNQGQCKHLLQFLRRVAESWTFKEQLEDVRDVTPVGPGYTSTPRAPYKFDPESRLDGKTEKHKLEHLMSTSKRRPTRKCRVCARRGLRKDTNKWCTSCQVPLHKGECFTLYHTKVNYWEE